jgi:hypothetical protein
MQFLIISLLLFNHFCFAKAIGTKYFMPHMGHLHEIPNSRSTSLTAIQCGDPVILHSVKSSALSADWSLVQFGDDRGYIKSEYLSDSRPKNCFRGKYPKFYEGLNLDVKEIYYWGKLYDQYEEGESSIQ